MHSSLNKLRLYQFLPLEFQNNALQIIIKLKTKIKVYRSHMPNNPQLIHIFRQKIRKRRTKNKNYIKFTFLFG